MPGKLDFVLKPWEERTDQTPASSAKAAYRDDPFDRVLEFFESDGTTPLDLSGEASFTAQVRKGDVLKSGTAGTPTLVFTVDDTDKATGVLVIHLTRTQTRTTTVTDKAVWDIQGDTTGATYLTGKFKVYGDVSRSS